MQKGFIFDTNKCTGCNACQIACSLENDVKLPLNWRQVNTYNPMQYQTIPHFHLSIACNHCINPSCMQFCPALAIVKDAVSGAVNIDPKKCIGCQYCSWVCPYDAPLFNPDTRIMEKCTFCLHRLEENLQPACVTLCPTAALQFSDIEQSPTAKITGFTHSEIKPAIEIIPLKKHRRLPEMPDLSFDPAIVDSFRKNLSSLPPKKKITCFTEWPLILFSLLSAVLIGQLAADLIAFIISFNPLYLIIAFCGLMITTLHLGKVSRAPRAILNWRRSWISREIIFYTGFIFFLTLLTLFFQDMPWLGWMSLLSGFIMLFCIDKIYAVVPTVSPKKIHSANMLLTVFFLTSLFSRFFFGVILFGSIKFILYSTRLIYDSEKSRRNLFLGLLRISCGFVLPALIWYMDLDISAWYTYSLIIFAELIDRCEFYDEFDIITPAKQMVIDLNKDLNTIRH